MFVLSPSKHCLFKYFQVVLLLLYQPLPLLLLPDNLIVLNIPVYVTGQRFLFLQLFGFPNHLLDMTLQVVSISPEFCGVSMIVWILGD